MSRIQSSRVAVLSKLKKAPVMRFVHLKPKKTLEICEAVPEKDWRKFSEYAHVAVSISQGRIFDGDNDYAALEMRCNAQEGDAYFIAPGDSEMAEVIKGRS